MALKTGAAKRLMDTFKSKDLVLPAMHRHVMKQVREEERDTTVLHPSAMSKKEWCGRHDWYQITGHKEERKDRFANPSFNMANALAEGHVIHEKYQRWLWEMGVLYGKWKCHGCQHKWMALSPQECPECLASQRRLEYLELPLHRKPFPVYGHGDGAVHDLDGWTGIIEVKSIGIGTLRFEAPFLYDQFMDGQLSLDELWMKVDRPFPSHYRQGMTYLWLSWPRYEQVCFIYESKWHQKTKEFIVTYNPRRIAPIIEVVREVADSLESGEPPSRPFWAEGPESSVCKPCSYRNLCWSDTHAVQESPTTQEQPVRVLRADKRKRDALLKA